MMNQTIFRDPPLVLIVDDDSTTRLLARAALEQAHFDIAEAVDGFEALAAFKRLKPDIVLLDILMPEMDGFAACAELRRLPGGGSAPILVITGLDDLEAITRAYEAGATDFIPKPINWTILSHRVRYMVRTGRMFAELGESERRLNHAQQIAHLGYWQWQIGRHKLIFSGEARCIFGLGPKEPPVMPEIFIDSSHAADRDAVRQALQAAQAAGQAFDIDYRLVRPDGSERLVHLRGEAVLDGAGQVIQINGTVQDISERKTLEKELKKVNAYLENLIENSADPIGLVDAHGEITKWNKSAEAIYGYNAAEINGKHFRAFYADPSEMNLMVEKLRRHGFVRNYEIAMRRKDGSIFPASLSISLLYNHDREVIGSITVARDLTEMKKNMTELQRVNARLQILVQETEQCNREANIINIMSEQLQSCLSCAEAYPIVMQQAQDLFPAVSGALFMLNTARDLMEVVATWGPPLAGERVFSPHECWALGRGRLSWTADPGLKNPCRHMASAKIKNYLCLPLLAQGETLGMLHVQDLSIASWERKASIRSLAVNAADHISMALVNIRLRETLRYQVIHDSLTDLFNRRYLEETLVREIYRVQRKGGPLGVIMLDLDHFKRFNDTFGHEAGDNLLRALGKYLLLQVRHEDVACRYGGEEFVLILPEASRQVVLARAEEIRRGVAQMQVFHRGQVLESTTVSLGVAMFPEHGVTGENLLQAADNAMYRAKESGRNRVVVASRMEPGSIINQ